MWVGPSDAVSVIKRGLYQSSHHLLCEEIMATKCVAVALLVACLPSTQTCVKSPALYKLGMVMPACNSSIWEVEDQKFKVLLSYTESQAILGCLRSCFKNGIHEKTLVLLHQDLDRQHPNSR